MNNNIENDPKLASEDEILDLLLAEYESNPSQVDEIDQKKAWRAIKDQLRQGQTETKFVPKAGAKSRPWKSLILASAVILIGLPLFINQPQTPYQNTKGLGVPLSTQLDAYLVSDDGDLILYKGHNTGTLVFKATVSQPVYIGLLLAKANEQPELRLITDKTLIGTSQLIERAGKAYGYQMESSEPNLRFCIVAAETLESMEIQVTEAKQNWHSLPRTSCISVTKP